MGKHLDLANEYVQWLKPRVEEKTWIRLDDIVVKDSSKYYPLVEHEDNDSINPDTLMFICRSYPNTIFMPEDHYDKNTLISEIYTSVAHEVAHLIHDIINKEEAAKLFPELSEDNDLSEEYALRELERMDKYLNNYERKSFQEGFAEYLSLDYILDIYDEKTQFFAKCKSTDLLRYKKIYPGTPETIYEIGYNFFKEVLGILGKDKFLKMARSPPISEIEVKMPFLYLSRNHHYKSGREHFKLPNQK